MPIIFFWLIFAVIRSEAEENASGKFATKSEKTNTGVRWPSAARKPMRMPSGTPSTRSPRNSEMATSLARFLTFSSSGDPLGVSSTFCNWSIIARMPFSRPRTCCSDSFRMKLMMSISFVFWRSFFQCFLAFAMGLWSWASCSVAITEWWVYLPCFASPEYSLPLLCDASGVVSEGPGRPAVVVSSADDPVDCHSVSGMSPRPAGAADVAR
mmetsp:Transcript_53072/g.137071  ORF Transcript_53072/g.137071 Transcript_53072/m.137071 type:complete len:211 (+) Transcript_53072:320-952(+)